MKNLLLFCLLIWIDSFVHAQNNRQFSISPASVWRVDSIDSNWKINENTKYFIRGDTIINFCEYLKLYKSGVAYYDVPFYYSDVYVGAIREENKKIYYLKKKTSKELWLYDFNLHTGDTIKSSIAKGNTILSIDSLPSGRKIFNYNFGHYTTGYIVEGIGTNGGLLSGGTSFIPLHSGENACQLICYTENGDLVYQNMANLNSNCDIADPPGQYSINTSAKWRYDRNLDNDTAEIYDYYQYYLSGDTTLNSMLYHKLYKKSNQLIKNKDGEYLCNLNLIEYSGGIRDQENRYYFIPKGLVNEELLYDFNIKKGDKNNGKVFRDEIVFDTDTILDNRKVIYFGTDRWNNRIISGIGSTTGFLNEHETYTYLKCFTENGVPVYHHYGTYDAELHHTDAIFPVCNNFQVSPGYSSIDPDKTLKIKTCYTSQNATIPELAGYKVEKSGYLLKVNLYYIDENSEKPAETLKTHILADSVPIGALQAGYYKTEIYVNSIHLNDTTFHSRFDYFFYIWYNPRADTEIKSVQPDVKIYPLPAKDRIYIDPNNSGMEIKSVEIYNLLGIKIIDEIVNSPEKIELNLNHTKRGIYIIKINGKNSFLSQKISIE